MRKLSVFLAAALLPLSLALAQTSDTPIVRYSDLRHPIFGEVSKGYEVVEKIEAVPTDGSDKPIDEQKIVKATVA